MPEPHSANSSVRTTALTASLFILLLAAYGLVSTRFKAMGDLSLYQAYAARALGSPMLLPREYPPLSAALFVIPQIIFPSHYRLSFALMAALACSLTVVIVDRLSRQGWWLVLYLALGAWGTLFFRFDIFVVLLTVLAYRAATHERWLLAQVLLASAVALKLYPLVLMPLVALWQWRKARRLPLSAALGGAVSLLLVAGSTWRLAPAATAELLRFHHERPLQLEAVGASLAWLMGPTATELSFGSVNLLSPLTPALVTSLTIANGVVLLALYACFLRGQLRPVVAWALSLLVTIATSKVFSTQYVLWALPFVALASAAAASDPPTASSTDYRWLWALICLLTGLVYPVGPELFETATQLSLVTLRNALWIAASVGMVYNAQTPGLWRRLGNYLLHEARFWRRRKRMLSVIVLTVIAVDLLNLRAPVGRSYALDIGQWNDEEVVRFEGMYKPETDSQGLSYRWSSAQSTLHLRSFAAASRLLVTLVVGDVPLTAAVPRPVQLQVDGAPVLTLPVGRIPRRYHLVLPRSKLPDGGLHLGITSMTSQVDPDPRELGIRLDDLIVAWPRGGWLLPTMQTLLLQVGLVLVGIAVARRLGLAEPGTVAVAAGLLLLGGWIVGHYPLMATAWQSRLTVASLILLALAGAHPGGPGHRYAHRNG